VRQLPRLLAILGLLGPVAGHRAVSAQGSALPGDVPEVVAGPDSLVLEWRVPAIESHRQPDGTVLFEIPGYSQLSRAGAPRLPFAAALVAVPEGSSPSVEILEVEEKDLSLPGTLALGSIPQGVERSPDGQVIGGAFAPPATEIPFNPEPVVVEPLGVLRGVHLARVIFYPVRPEGENLRLATQVRVAVHFNETLRPDAQAETGLDPLLATLKSVVVNPEQMHPGESPGLPSSLATYGMEVDDPVAAVEVARRGLTSISYEGLVVAGIPVAGINPLNLRLTRSGTEIPYEWEGDGDTQFEPGERLLFYADPRFSRWTPVDVYFLSQGQTPAPPMSTRSADPAGLPGGNPVVETLVEKNRIYTPDCFCAPIPPGRDGDRWVWDDLHRPARPATQYEFDLASVAGEQPGSLTIWLIGYTDVGADPDHRVNIALNGTHLGQVNWDGKQAVSNTLSIPAQVLKNGSNTLSLSLPGIPGVAIEGTWLDAFSIRFSRSLTGSGNDLLFTGDEVAHSYQISLDTATGLRAYDVSDTQQLARLTGVIIDGGKTITLGDPASPGKRNYYVTNGSGIFPPERLRQVKSIQAGSNSNGADYLVIAHHDFLPALTDLIQLRRAQGWTVLVEEVQAIYDAYGEGKPEPAAIHAYLEAAYKTWKTRPVHVLLVGDGTYDPKQNLEGSSGTFIPPFLAEVDPWAGETAADNRYVTVEGDDNLPDMLVGRLPVNSLVEAQTVVEKIVRYETQPAPGSWPGTGIVAADDPDDGGDFPFIAESILGPVTGSLVRPQRFYHLPPQVSASAVRQGILSAWNTGSALATYFGHASIHQWGVEQYLHLEDVNGLHNGHRLPLVLEMTCFTSSFQVPGFETLDEALLRHPGGGAIGTWGATGLGIATGHATLAESFLEAAIGERADFGTAALSGKLDLAIRNPDHLDLIDTFTLLGDPATKLNLAVGEDLFYLPLIQQ
jgi:hypothetical protein